MNCAEYEGTTTHRALKCHKRHYIAVGLLTSVSLCNVIEIYTKVKSLADTLISVMR